MPQKGNVSITFAKFCDNFILEYFAFLLKLSKKIQVIKIQDLSMVLEGISLMSVTSSTTDENVIKNNILLMR